MTTNPLTQGQMIALSKLAKYSGKPHVRVHVGSGERPADCVASINSSTLRGLEARGRIRIIGSIWRVAIVSVVGLQDSDMGLIKIDIEERQRDRAPAMFDLLKRLTYDKINTAGIMDCRREALALIQSIEGGE